MLDDDLATGSTSQENAPEAASAVRAESPAGDTPAPAKKRTRKAPAKKAAAAEPTDTAEATAPAPSAEPPTDAETPPPAKKRTRKAPAKKAAAPAADTDTEAVVESAPEPTDVSEEPAAPPKARKRGSRAKKAAPAPEATEDDEAGDTEGAPAVGMPLFKAPEPTTAAPPEPAADATAAETSESGEQAERTSDDESGEGDGARRRRRRGGRRRRKSSDGDGADAAAVEDDTTEPEAASEGESADDAEAGESPSSRRRRRRRRAGDDNGSDSDQEPQAKTTTRGRRPRNAEDEITSVQGSTRLEAKKQRRREGREAGRRRAPIVSEAEFLARRESVERVMAIRQREDVTQIAVLEDKVLVEHYVARESQTSLIGNVYLGRVQNVLPSMEAAFVDIGKGRNAVLYAGEVNWSALGHKEGSPRKIESVLSSGQSVLVQVTKDPIGHKGARLTSQVSLAGRFLVYVPDGTTSGISRKLPDTERNRLKTLLKEIVPDTAGVIVRTAAEGAAEDELVRDVERLKARWEDIEKKAAHKGAGAQLLYGEPDLTLKVVRDLFTEDFSRMVVEGDDAWDIVQSYVSHIAPDLEERLEHYDAAEQGVDLFASLRIEEQIHKGLDRKVWLPSGGSLVIDRTEAMTVVDVNTGKFTGSGGNLEETVTKNNLEAAEEIVRQLRLRDIGGIIVVDFIDMVLESNRDLVLRRLVECLGRDRTRHQVAEVTSLGLVQMTRKRIGTGLLEAFSETCDHCSGRGVIIQDAPVEPRRSDDAPRGGARKSRGGRGRGDNGNGNGNGNGRRHQGERPLAAGHRGDGPGRERRSPGGRRGSRRGADDQARRWRRRSPSPRPSRPRPRRRPGRADAGRGGAGRAARGRGDAGRAARRRGARDPGGSRARARAGARRGAGAGDLQGRHAHPPPRGQPARRPALGRRSRAGADRHPGPGRSG